MNETKNEAKWVLSMLENSDAGCIKSNRYFREFENAKAAMMEDFEKRGGFRVFPPADENDPRYDEDYYSTDIDDAYINVHDGMDTYDWSIDEIRPED